ncbi:MAG: hypothetical protein GX811_01195 [Lentisphaerae bacterium]|nr:hypothetical protein [Lentisphaerota bacterium]
MKKNIWNFAPAPAFKIGGTGVLVSLFDSPPLDAPHIALVFRFLKGEAVPNRSYNKAL